MQNLTMVPYSKIENKDSIVDTVFSIENTDFQNIVNFRDDVMTYYLHNCFFSKLIVSNSTHLPSEDVSILFDGCLFEELEIVELQSSNISISFYNCIILSGSIKSSNLLSVNINNCIIRDSIFIMNQKSIRISYTEENIFPRFWQKLIRNIDLNVSELISSKQRYYIYECRDIEIKFNEVDSDKRGYYLGLHNDPDYKLGYYLTQFEKDSLNVSLHITYKLNVGHNETKILGAILNSLSLTGYSEGKLNIENCKISNIFLRDFSSQKELNFYNVRPRKLLSSETKVEIHKSNLNNSWFDNVRFDEYSIVSIYRTKFGKSTFTSCTFPSEYTEYSTFKSLANVHYPDEKSDNYYNDQYEIFLQLKNSLDATGNFYESQKLQAISNNALMKIGQVNKWDKFILSLNDISNSHGLSIKKPLLLFFLTTIPLYLTYLWSLGKLLNSNEFDPILIGYYFSFIDITHRSDFLVKNDYFTVWSLVIDSLTKIIISYLIYQFIAAFRKYGKK